MALKTKPLKQVKCVVCDKVFQKKVAFQLYCSQRCNSKMYRHRNALKLDEWKRLKARSENYE